MSLKVEDLKFSYGKRNVLDGATFEVPDRCLCAVLGANGAGKTTMFKCILGMLKKYTGCIEIDGTLTKNLSVRELAHRIAYIPQIHGQTFDYSVRDMVLMGTDHALSPLAVPGAAENEKAEAAMERVGIQEKAHKYFSRLSGGEQQLVLVARALAQGSKTLLMDEPTSALDYGNQNLVLEQVRSLADEGYCVILSTHTPQQALWYADKVIAVNNGKIEADGAPEDVLNEELVKSLYGLDARFIDTADGRIICPPPRKK